MTERQITEIYIKHLFPIIPRDELFGADDLIAIALRESSWKAIREISSGKNELTVLQNMKGDYNTKQPYVNKELSHYQGFSVFQIDIRSYREFIISGKWKDMKLSAEKSLAVLHEKRIYLEDRKLIDRKNNTHWLRSIYAAYNSGQGNVAKAIRAGLDVDRYTYNGDYSKDVMRRKLIVSSLLKAKAVNGINIKSPGSEKGDAI